MKRKFWVFYVQYELGDNHPGQFNVICQNCGVLFSGMAFHFSDLLRNAKYHRCPDILSSPFELELDRLFQKE